MTMSKSRLAAGVGGVALALTAGAGIAAAGPEDAAVNTTCTYPQVVAAMHAQSPELADQFNATPAAQGFLQNFLAAPPPQRQQMLQQVESSPQAAQLVSAIVPIADSCSKY
ncbi:MAG TPA: hemophore-related protein [Mycobacterium sp.]|nr:hemophore-related protein [Mycobacterium sp.]